MQTLVVYYSYTGKTRKLAEDTAAAEQADLLELKERKRRSVVGAYVAGSLAAIRGKEADLEDPGCDFRQFERFIAAAPIWAGNPAPAFNNLVRLLPEGSEVSVLLTSASGSSGNSAQKIREKLEAKGCKVKEIRDVKCE